MGVLDHCLVEFEVIWVHVEERTDQLVVDVVHRQPEDIALVDIDEFG